VGDAVTDSTLLAWCLLLLQVLLLLRVLLFQFLRLLGVPLFNLLPLRITRVPLR
jgi:hypothetical protein